MISAELQPEPNLEMTMDDQEALSFELDGTVVLPTTAGALVDLADVQIASPTNNQVLKYNSTTEKWVNGSDNGATWGQITGTLSNQTDSQTALNGKVNTESGKGLSTNDYTAEDKTKLEGIESGAQVNIINGIKVNGTSVIISGGVADIPRASFNNYGVIAFNSSDSSGIDYSNSKPFLYLPSNAAIDARKTRGQSGFGAISTQNLDYAWKSAEAAAHPVKTTLDNVLVPCAQYYLGEQSSLTLTLPSTANAGQMITVDFASGVTPTSLNISGNVAGDITYAPEANTLVEINFKFDGTYWKMLVSSVEKPSE